MPLTNIKLGDYIANSTSNNSDLKYGEELITGVNSNGVFAPPKGSTLGVDLNPYKIVNNGAFVYNPTRLNLGSLAYRTEGLCIVSHLYMVFYLTEEGQKIIDPQWLYIYFHREEFKREVTFRNFGSQRPEFNFKDMSDIIVPLPDIDTQRKYAGIYNAMIVNQQSYERGLEDLKLTCDAFIEDLRKKISCQEIGNFIQQENKKNTDKFISRVMGLSTKKEFREAQSRVNKNELGNYKIVKQNDFAFVPTTDTWKVLAFSYNNQPEKIVVSPIYSVFSINEKVIIPAYLAMWLSRTEFDRYARFNSWGSARENFSYEDMCHVEIPIPSIEIQQDIVNIYFAFNERKSINEKLKSQIKDICPILIKGSIEEAKKSLEA